MNMRMNDFETYSKTCQSEKTNYGENCFDIYFNQLITYMLRFIDYNITV